MNEIWMIYFIGAVGYWCGMVYREKNKNAGNLFAITFMSLFWVAMVVADYVDRIHDE